MKPGGLYLALCILGVILPYSQLVPFLRDHGFDMGLFVEQMFSQRIAGFFSMDVIVATLVLWAFVAIEGGRAQMKHLWIPITASLTVGVSLGLPLFLYMREVQREPAPAARARS